MKILVTGGAGFIGSTIVDEYIKVGHRVWVIDNESSGKKKQVHPSANYTRLDIRNGQKLARFFSGKKFDVVNHHAAQIDVRRSVSDPIFDAEVNVLGLLNVLEESRKSKVKKIIFSSSGGTIYGECTRPALESDPEVPLSPYGVAKLASEKYIQAYADLHGIKFTIFRYSNVYGPRQDPHGEAGVVAIFSNRLIDGEQTFIFGTGRQTRDFVFVGDLARANHMALSKADNQIVNLGTGSEISILQLYKVMASFFPSARKPKFKPARAGELNRSVLKCSKARRVLGWRPETTLTQGLEKTLQYFKNQSA